MRIIIVTDTYPPHVNGAANFSSRLAQTLVARHHQVLVLAPALSLATKRRRQDNVDVLGIGSLPLFVNNVRAAAPNLARRKIYQAIRSFAPEVIHAQGHFFLSRAVAAEARRLNIPVIGTNHFMPENLTPYLHLGRYLTEQINTLMWKQSYSFFRRLNAVTTPTATAAALFKEHGFDKPVLVISNGIDVERFSPASEPLCSTDEVSHKLTALFVGRLDKEKHVDVAIAATLKARQQLDMQLIVAGSDKGSEAHRLRQLVQKLNLAAHVTFTGFVHEQDLPALYRRADVFVIPSTAELQSLVTMEAMASGLPIIAANAVALPELVNPGENGWLFEPGNADELAAYLVQVLSDKALARRMGEASRRLVAKHALDSVMAEFESLYRSVQA